MIENSDYSEWGKDRIVMQIGGSIQSSFKDGVDLNIDLSWILNSICNFGISLDGKTFKIFTEKKDKGLTSLLSNRSAQLSIHVSAK